MHYDHYNRPTPTADYASIAHGMPEYRFMSAGEVDHHLTLARREQSRLMVSLVKSGLVWMVGLFGSRRTSEA